MKQLAIVLVKGRYTTDADAKKDSAGEKVDVFLMGGEVAIHIHIPKGVKPPKILLV